MITVEKYLNILNPYDGLGRVSKENCKLAMIEFAKICCTEQAKVISEKAKVDVGEYSLKNGKKVVFLDDTFVDKESILNAYDLNSIK